MTTPPKTKARRVGTDKMLKHRLTQAERQLKAMKDRKAKKAQRKALNRAINSNFRNTFELIDDLSKILVVHGDDQL
jgi:ferritin-like metal-binding protein YciE